MSVPDGTAPRSLTFETDVQMRQSSGDHGVGRTPAEEVAHCGIWVPPPAPLPYRRGYTLLDTLEHNTQNNATNRPSPHSTPAPAAHLPYPAEVGVVPPGKAQTSLHAYTRRAPHAPDTCPFSPLASPDTPRAPLQRVRHLLCGRLAPTLLLRHPSRSAPRDLLNVLGRLPPGGEAPPPFFDDVTSFQT